MTLRECCLLFSDGDWIESKDQSDQGIRLIQTGNVGNGEYLEKENRAKYISYDTFSRLGCTEIYPGDILISRLPDPVGRACIIPEKKERMITAVDCSILRVNQELVSRDYLLYFLMSPQYYNQLTNKLAGTTRVRISRKNLEQVVINLPHRDIQESIVNKINCLRVVISKRKEQLLKLDNLIKARFVEMFGTYPANEKRWDTGIIRDIVKDVKYGSSKKAAIGNTGKYPYLRMNNITYQGELDLSDVKTIDIPDSELSKCSVQKGDVLFNRTNSKELVGKTCVYNRSELMVLAGFIIRVRVNDKMLPEVLSEFLNASFSKQMLFSMCKAAIGQANINAQEMQNIGIFIPPINVQKEYVAFKSQVDKSKVDGVIIVCLQVFAFRCTFKY